MKRKHTVLLVESKLAILDHLKAGTTNYNANLVEEYGFGRATVTVMYVYVL